MMVFLFSCLWLYYAVTVVELVLEIVPVFSVTAIPLFVRIEESKDSTQLRTIPHHLVMLLEV
jgi:hypothetical protein